MPKALLEYMGYCIYFWIGDGEEPVHVHVSKKDSGKTPRSFGSCLIPLNLQGIREAWTRVI